MDNTQQQDLTELTVELLSAFVANNSVRSDDLPGLIASTHAALSGLASASTEAVAAANEAHPPAVTARKSLSNRDFIISLIDGKPYKSLKRHLTGHGLTPQEYRARYNLPATYPMVAPGYSDARREVAKRLGLGRRPQHPDAAPAPKPRRKPRASKEAAAT
jgi:predicted transcriptional regulator